MSLSSVHLFFRVFSFGRSLPSEIIQLGSPILKSTIPRKKYQDFLQGKALTVSFDIIVNSLSDSKYDFRMQAH